MKAILITLLIASTLSIRFDLPKALVADDGLLNKEMQSLANTLIQGQWQNAFPAGLALFGKMSKMVSKKQSPVPALFKFTSKKNECPYIKCVKRRLGKAKRVAKMYFCALWHGKVLRARKILKCLNKRLRWATGCKRQQY